jgi:hypothetical protein
MAAWGPHLSSWDAEPSSYDLPSLSVSEALLASLSSHSLWVPNQSLQGLMGLQGCGEDGDTAQALELRFPFWSLHILLDVTLLCPWHGELSRLLGCLWSTATPALMLQGCNFRQATFLFWIPVGFSGEMS